MPQPQAEALFRLYFQDFEDRAYEAEAAAEMASRLRERSQAAAGRSRALAEHQAQISALEQRYNSASAEFVTAQRQRVSEARYAAFQALSALLEAKVRSMAEGGAEGERYRGMLRASLRDCVPQVPAPALVSCRREDEETVRSLLRELQEGRGAGEEAPGFAGAAISDSWLPSSEPGLRICASDGSVAFDERLQSRVSRAMECYQAEVTARLFPAC